MAESIFDSEVIAKRLAAMPKTQAPPTIKSLSQAHREIEEEQQTKTPAPVEEHFIDVLIEHLETSINVTGPNDDIQAFIKRLKIAQREDLEMTIRISRDEAILAF